MAVLLGSLLFSAVHLVAQEGTPGSAEQPGAAEGPSPADQAAEVLRALRAEPSERTGAFQDRGALLRAGFDAFIERMDAFDGDASVALATELYAEDPAIWSGFCLEGALRRSADAEASGQSAPCRTALEMLRGLRESYTGNPSAQLDVTHRIAILGAGFGDRRLERAALGRALAAGGIDGAQISGLAALRADRATALKLFGSQLDRALHRGAPEAPGAGELAPKEQDDESVTPSSLIDKGAEPSWLPPIQPEAAPWALRGHALASLELLRGSSSN